MHSFSLRVVEGSDFSIWLPLWLDYQRFYKVEFAESVTLETWNRFLDPSEPMHAVIATAGEHSLGLAHFIYHRSTWTVADDCYLQDLFVSPDSRGGGIGRALVEYVCTDAKAHGASRVHWLTHRSNSAGRRLYDKIARRSGFIQYRKPLG